MSGEDDPEPGGFIDRWSRRKRAAVAPPEAQEPAPATAAAAPSDAPSEEPTPEEVAEAVAALPPVETIDAGTDLAPWLRRGVPAALKNAALRRMWSIDPAIRDYRDLAVDYAWDWNTPGGLPGGGGAVSADSVAELVRGLGRKAEAEPVAEPPREMGAAPAAPDAPAGPGEAVEPAAVPFLPAAGAVEAADAGSDEAQAAPQGTAPPRPRPRRHGGATPT